VAVAANARNHDGVRSFDDLSRNLLNEIEHFFVSYNQIKGKRFEPLGRFDSERAEELVGEGARRFRARRRKAAPKKRR
jgi:inorganic pyrophosphatase